MTPDPVRSVLAPTDFSPAAEAGLAWAGALAAKHGARLHLVHAAPLFPIVSEDAPVRMMPMEEITAAARKDLEKVAADLGRDGLEVECHVADGPAYRVILDIADEIGADVVVISTRGTSGLRYLLLGSTTRRVVQMAPCPVLSVHPEDGRPETSPRSVFVPTALEDDVDGPVAALSRIFGPFEAGAQLVLFHSWKTAAETSRYGRSFVPPERAEEVNRLLVERLDRKAAALRARGFAVETVVVEGLPTRAITDQVSDRDCQLVAMSTRATKGLEHAILGSVAERVVQLASCPVLTVSLEPDAPKKP